MRPWWRGRQAQLVHPVSSIGLGILRGAGGRGGPAHAARCRAGGAEGVHPASRGVAGGVGARVQWVMRHQPVRRRRHGVRQAAFRAEHAHRSNVGRHAALPFLPSFSTFASGWPWIHPRRRRQTRGEEEVAERKPWLWQRFAFSHVRDAYLHVVCNDMQNASLV